MKYKLLAFVFAVTGLAALASCETMSAEECAAADWTALGFQDASRNGASNFGDRADDCSERGLIADSAAYERGLNDGMRVFCTPENGFRYARGGGNFRGQCAPDLAEQFSYAYADGQRVNAVEQALRQAEQRVSSLESNRREIDDNIGSNEGAFRDATTDADRARYRAEIDRLQRERRRVNDDIRTADAALPRLRREVNDLRYEIGDRWGAW